MKLIIEIAIGELVLGYRETEHSFRIVVIFKKKMFLDTQIIYRYIYGEKVRSG